MPAKAAKAIKLAKATKPAKETKLAKATKLADASKRAKAATRAKAGKVTGAANAMRAASVKKAGRARGASAAGNDANAANANAALRAQLAKILDWQDAHVSLDSAIDGIAPDLRGVQPEGLPYSAWQLVEHLRITQDDILDFCRNAGYEERDWPDDYWPEAVAPSSDAAWQESLDAYRRDRRTLADLAADTTIDLFATIPHGSGQTYLRELLLVADHNAYHVGQLVAVRRLLGIWKA